MNNDNRTNKMFDNDMNRVVERARKYGFAPSCWQVIDTTTWNVNYTNDTTPYERGNNGRFLFSPIFDPMEVNINGYPV